MTDVTPVVVPNIVTQLAAAGARHALTTVAGSLVTAGLMSSDQTAQFVSVLSGVAVALAAIAWSMIQKEIAHQTLLAGIAAPPPQ